MKRSKRILSVIAILVLLAMTVLAVSACGGAECEEHIDNDCDNKCDNCQADVQIGHVDKNGDGKCDKCRECVSHVDATCDGECDNCYAEIPVVHIDEDEDNECDRCGRRVEALKVNAKKTASVPAGITVNSVFYSEWNYNTIKGDTVTFTITVENTGKSELTAVITDTVPANTSYVSGCDNKVNDILTWTEVIGVGETKSVSYTVEVTAKDVAPGTCIPGNSASVNGKRISGYDVYIENTLNEVDAKTLEKAVRILSTSTFEHRDFAKFVYYVAFSNASAAQAIPEGAPWDAVDKIFRISENYAEAIAPGMYGGTSAKELEDARGVMNTPVTAADFISGDLLYVKSNGEGKMYIFSEGELHDITSTFTDVDTDAVIASLPQSTKYAVIRPSLIMTAFTPSDPEAPEVAMNAYQEAIVRTAEAFMLRGESLQYEDVWFGLNSESGEHRWTHGVKQPEEYTYDEWGYVNCAVFTYDVYKMALGYSLPGSMYTTQNLTNNSNGFGMREFYFENTTPGNYSEDFMLEKQREFMNTLQVGDLMVVRRMQEGKTGEVSGHVMLYIGNGKFMHSSGSSFKQATSGVGEEVAEPTIRYCQVTDYFFDPSSIGGNPFRGPDEYGDRYVNKLLIVRPLNKFDNEIPENTAARVQNMTDIRADKTSSHPSSTSVNPGDLITFTFTLFNVGDVAKTIEIFDKAPVGTTYVSGCDNVSGDELRWSVTVGANETVKVSYTVRVNNVADGTVIDGRDATVGGVMHRCAAIRVKNTLTITEQDAIKAAIDELRDEMTTLKGLELVNEIYKRALGKTGVFEETDIDKVFVGEDYSVFLESDRTYSNMKLNKLRLAEQTYYSRMLVDHLYGGQRFDSTYKQNDRTKMLKPHNLIVGDILLARTNSKSSVYIYAGDGMLINLTDGLGVEANFENLSQRIMFFGRNFGVLRPSYVIEE